jgi:hypothetical protein
MAGMDQSENDLPPSYSDVNYGFDSIPTVSPSHNEFQPLQGGIIGRQLFRDSLFEMEQADDGAAGAAAAPTTSSAATTIG